MQYMEKALAELDEQIATLQQTRTHMAAALGRPVSFATNAARSSRPSSGPGSRKPMSEEAKQRIRDAQARRWAAKNGTTPATPEPETPQPEPETPQPEPALAPTTDGVEIGKKVAAMEDTKPKVEPVVKKEDAKKSAKK